MSSRFAQFLRAFAFSVVLAISTAPSNAQTALTPEPVKAHIIVLKNAPPNILAWWFDPTNNPPLSPAEIAFATANPNKPVALPEGVEKIVAIEPQKALLIFADDAGFALLQRQIELLDKPLQQVEIEAQFVQVSTSDSRAFGIRFSAAQGNFTLANPNPEPPANAQKPTLQIGFVRNDFQATLTALLNANRAKVLTAPRVTVLNNSAGRIILSLLPRPFIIVSAVSQGMFDQYERDMKAYIEATKNAPAMIVVPTIKDDNTITISLSFAPTESKTKPEETQNPSTKIWEALQKENYVFNVKNGETVALGGLKDDFFPKSEKKIPMLNDIPFYSELFRSKTPDNKDEILVFLTARAVHRQSDDEAPIPGAD